MKRTVRERILNPKPNSKVAAAIEFGNDLTLLIRKVELTPQQRIDSMFESESLLKTLSENNISFVLVGGAALSCYKIPYGSYPFQFCYSRKTENLKNIVSTLSPFNPKPRDFPENLSYIFDESTLLNATNFTFQTDIGDIDLLDEVAGIGNYEAVENESVIMELFDFDVKVLSLNGLIKAKRAAGRQKDLLVLPELEALKELLEEEE